MYVLLAMKKNSHYKQNELNVQEIRENHENYFNSRKYSCRVCVKITFLSFCQSFVS